MNLAALKTLARHHAAPSLLGAGMAALDYRGRRAAGEGVLPSVAQAAFWNIAPAIMFAGPYALPLEIAFSMLPAIPGGGKGGLYGLFPAGELYPLFRSSFFYVRAYADCRGDGGHAVWYEVHEPGQEFVPGRTRPCTHRL